MTATLVVGATGNIGQQVVTQLAAAGAKVRAFARGPAPATLPPGVEYARGSLTEPDQLATALRGVEAVFLLWPFFSAEHGPAVLELIGRHARRVVYLSSNGVDDDADAQPDPINQFHADLEGLVRAHAQEWTMLRAGGLAINTLHWAPDIRTESVVREPFPHAARSLVHEADVAAVAIHALTDARHAGATYDLTGPAALTTVEQVAAIGAAIGRELRVEQTPVEQVRTEWLAQGMPADVVDGILSAHAGMKAAPEPVTHTIEQVTGVPARTFGQWAVDHAADFR